MKKPIFLALGCVLAGASFGQSSIVIAGSVNFAGAAGNPLNSVRTATSGSNFVMGSNVTVVSTTLTSGGIGSWQDEAYVRVSNSAIPTLFNTFNFTSIGGTFTTYSVPANTVRPWAVNQLGAASIASGSVWTLEFFDSINDGGDAVDATGSSINFTINGTPGAPYSFSNAGPIQSLANDPFNPANPSYTGPTVVTAFALGALGVASATYNQAVPGDFPSDTVVIVRNSGRPADWAFIRPIPVNSSVASTTTANASVVVGGPMVGRTMASGTTMSFTFSNNPTDGAPAGLEATISNFSLSLNAAGAAGTAPPATNLGILTASNSPLLTAVGALGANQVKWYRFDLPQNIGTAFGSTYLDAFTSGTSGFDTEIGLYNDLGYLVGTDDDGDDALFSALSFGAGVNPASGDGEAFVGQDGGSLPAGTYYVAVGEFDAIFANAFGATALSPGSAGTVNLNLRTNLLAASANLTGNLNLLDTGVFAFNRSISYVVKQGTSTIGSGTVIATASSSSFSLSVPSTATGAATIEWDGSSFLLRKSNVNLTGSNIALGSVNLQNGDVDNSGEVDAADIDAVIAVFGSTANAPTDADVSGEVDAADIDLVIANFGGVND